MFAAPIMIVVNTSFALDHERLRRAVDDIHSKGFDTICLEFRNCIFDEYDPQGKAAMKVVAERTRELGLKFVKIMPMLGPNIVKLHPEARQIWAVEHRAKAVGGRFTFALRVLPNTGYVSTTPSFREIVRAYHVTRDEGTGAIVRAVDITNELAYSVEVNEAFVANGTCERDGEMLVYVAYHTDYIDFSFGGICRTVDDFMAQYEGLPLDGVAIDEFGAGSRMRDVYFIGDAFREEFRERSGYELLDKLYLLLNEADGECAGKVRYDYYQQTMEHTYKLQNYVKKRYEEKYGKDLFGGFHNTWWGEGNSGDLWAANIDYFRLTENLSGGFVDAQFDAERTMTSMTMLAESLAKFSDSGLAYNMCWDRLTTPEKLDYYQRMLAVRNVRWVAHTYGVPGHGPGYPDHSTWELAGLSVRREKALQSFIGPAVSKPKVAMMYIWESVACFNNDFMHYHRLSMKALLDKMLARHIEIDIVPTYDNQLERFDTLIVLWPTMMPEAAWSNIKAYAASGKRIVFIGPPAHCTTEGRDIRAEFERLTGAGCPGIHAGSRYSGEYEYVAWDLWFTNEKIPMDCYPLQPSDGSVCLADDGAVLGVSNGNVEYFAFELPLTAYFDAILDSLEPYREHDLPESVISKVSYDGETSVLTLTGRWNAPLHVLFDFKGNRIAIRGGALAGLRFEGGGFVAAISEEGAKLEVNGRAVDFVRI